MCLLLILGVGLLAAQVVAAQLRSTALDQEAEAVAAPPSSGASKSQLRAEDLQRPLTPQRMAEIDRLVQDRVMGAGTVGVSLWRGDGVVAYSTDPSSVGRSGKDDDHLALALAGEVKLSKEIKPRSEVDFNLAEGSG